MTEPYSTIIRYDKVRLSPAFGSVISLEDGRLMWVWGAGSPQPPQPPLCANYSEDGGRTWGDPVDLQLESGEPLCGSFTTNLFRLPSDAIGLAFRTTGEKVAFHFSRDEGASWSDPVLVHGPGERVFMAGDRCITLRDGRLIVPVYSGLGFTPIDENPKIIDRFGTQFSQAERCGLSFAYVYYSDDEGRTWNRSRNEAFVALDKGVRGNFSMGEPAVVELNDGRLFMLGRNNLGRYFQSFSEDRGETWIEPTPTELALYPSPCNLKRIPTTGDLLVIWNQISRWEAMNGLYRHRLSCAISNDEGRTWQHHKNLISLDHVTHIEPGAIEQVLMGPMRQPLDRQRYHRAPGPLRCNEPTCTFLDGTAVITHGVCVFGDKEIITRTYGMDYDKLMEDIGLAPFERGNKVHVLPIDWFYGVDPLR